MYCFYHKEIDGYDSVAWLNINYQPNVTAFYETDYFKNFKLGKHISFEVFNFEIELNSNYLQLKNAIFTPPALATYITNQNPTIFCKETQNGIIGIGNKAQSLLFDTLEIIEFFVAIQNYRGLKGRNSLNVGRNKSESFCIRSVSDSKICIAHFKKIKKLLGLPMRKFHYDEHY